MSTLFAGISETGETRFIGDVPSGLACGCFCLSCSSRLEAKKGTVRIWHFAHVAGQERPECLAGALNLLRRLALQILSTSSPFPIPAHLEHVTDTRPHIYGRRSISKAIESRLMLASGAAITWADSFGPKALPPRTHPIGTAPLANGAQLEIFVDVRAENLGTSLGDEAAGNPNAFKLLCWCPAPKPGEVTSTKIGRAHV